MAIRAGHYFEVDIYQCSNPDCNFEGAPTHIMQKYESWSLIPTRQLAQITEGLKNGLYREFQYWQPDYKRHKPVEWQPPPLNGSEDGDDWYWGM